MKGKTIAIVLVSVAALAGVGALAYSKGWIGSKPSEDDFKSLVDASNASGSDTFAGVSIKDVATKLKNATKKDIARMVELMKSPNVKTATSAESKEFMTLFEKSTGEKVVS